MLNHSSDSCTATEGELSLLNHPSFDVNYVENGNYVCLRWKGPQTLATVKTGYKQLHELLLTSGADKVLNDGRDVEGSWTATIPWIVYCFLPLAQAAGVLKAAHVLCQERESRMSAYAFQIYADSCEWNIALFRTIGEAEDWLVRGPSGLST
jgi:hypothetical protein